MLHTPKTERLYLNPSQVSQLLASLSEPCRTLVLVAVLTGLRIGELLALRWKVVDFIRGTVQVRETVSEGKFGSMRTAQSLLGHSDLETTLNVYTHAIPDAQRRVVDKVADILFTKVHKIVPAAENEKVN